MAADADVVGPTELDHAVEQLRVLIQLALPSRPVPVVPAEPGLESRCGPDRIRGLRRRKTVSHLPRAHRAARPVPTLDSPRTGLNAVPAFVPDF